MKKIIVILMSLTMLSALAFAEALTKQEVLENSLNAKSDLTIKGPVSVPVTKYGAPVVLDERAALPNNLPVVGSRNPSTLDAVIISEGFEGLPNGTLPAGWFQIDVDGGFCSQFNRLSTWQAFNWSAAIAHSGTNVAMCHYNNNALPNDDWLIIPVGVLQGPITFSYWRSSQDLLYLDSYELRISTTGTSPADFTNLIIDEDAIPVSWVQKTFDLSAYAGAAFYIGFHYNSVDEFALKLDDVLLEAAGAAAPIGRCCYSNPTFGGLACDDTHDELYCSQLGGDFLVGATCTSDPCIVPCDVCQGTLYASSDLQHPIPDNGLVDPCLATGGTASSIIIPPTSATVVDVNVNVNITHTYTGDLAIVLEHDGVSVVLKSRAATGFGASCENIYTTFDDGGAVWVPADCPHDGCFQTYDQHNCGNDLLSAFDGMNVSGNWNLYVADGANADVGTLDSWSLCITEESTCEVPNPAIVDVTEGIPMCQCVQACADERLIVCFAPLSFDEKPIEFRIDDACDGDPFREAETLPGYGCDAVDCPPANPDTVGEFFYSPDLGGWCIIVIAENDGCFCICIDDILPVELIGFDAVAGDETVSLSWTTASEVNNDRFEILRDAVMMASIDASNYSAGSHYTWTDSYDLTNGREYSYSLVAVSMNGISKTIGTINATPTMSAAAITEYALHQNYPNPFNPETNIIFDIVESGNVVLTVYNPLGQTVATLINGNIQSGRHTVTFDGANLPSGLYYYRLEAGDFSAVKKMVLMK